MDKNSLSLNDYFCIEYKKKQTNTLASDFKDRTIEVIVCAFPGIGKSYLTSSLKYEELVDYDFGTYLQYLDYNSLGGTDAYKKPYLAALSTIIKGKPTGWSRILVNDPFLDYYSVQVEDKLLHLHLVVPIPTRQAVNKLVKRILKRDKLSKEKRKNQFLESLKVNANKWISEWIIQFTHYSENLDVTIHLIDGCKDLPFLSDIVIGNANIQTLSGSLKLVKEDNQPVFDVQVHYLGEMKKWKR